MKAKSKNVKVISSNIYVVDTSIIIDGKVSGLIESGEIKGSIIVPMAVLCELEHQANTNQTEGFLGLEEIGKLRKLADEGKIKFRYEGEKPKEFQIRGARSGMIDDLIRDTAVKNNAILITGDKVQSLVAEALGLKTMLLLPVVAEGTYTLNIEPYFDENTMSVHIKENTIPIAKRGRPGKWTYTRLSEDVLDVHAVKLLASDIVEKTKLTAGAFIELSNQGITIVQYKNYRIVIAKPPFADGWEITIARPVAQLSLADYKLSERVKKRLDGSASGVLISGAPGSGKSTFAAALAKYYFSKEKIVKTIESPRDLQLPDEIVQYSKNLGNRDDIHNVLLLTRPDYTIFDEMRTTEDFRMYSDLRLAGIGLAGVVHATLAIDAIQRFVNKIELGMIPHIIDTVIFIKDGVICKVFELEMKVKVPAGMTEADLARPVVVIYDFESGEPEYEMYTFGEQTVVVPVVRKKLEVQDKMQYDKIAQYFRKVFGFKPKVEGLGGNRFAVYVSERDVAKVLGHKGKRIAGVEAELGVSIDVRS